MRRRVLAAASTGIACLVLSLGAGTAYAATQPADLGNVENIERGASAPGPHCHLVQPAAGNIGFDSIITGAAHQAHTETGLSDGIFVAAPCP
jgi:hypothetical protein